MEEKNVGQHDRMCGLPGALFFFCIFFPFSLGIDSSGKRSANGLKLREVEQDVSMGRLAVDFRKDRLLQSPEERLARLGSGQLI
ncbi:hypothetical protein BDW59DRAFT_33141 [Aspergillus cavernicola]|uniref:Uncharacterized protein n=1 Tax=Aspergillus cavernicola TaxID=176166 RepID=A0ABR4IPL2_9EURO